MTERTSWKNIKEPRTDAAQQAYDDEARISEFRELVHRLRSEAGLTQAELAERMGTTQSAIARLEGGGARQTSMSAHRASAARRHPGCEGQASVATLRPTWTGEYSITLPLG